MLHKTDQAAEYLNVTSQRLRQWRHEGKGPAYYKMGGQVRYRQEDLDQFLALTRRETEQVERLLAEFGADAR